MNKFLVTILLLLCAAYAQQPATKPAESANPDISGMYSFLHDGEFVEVDIDEGGVTGFVSRYGEADSDRGAFLDHMFTMASLEGDKLTFTTRSVHGVSFEFKGTVERGDGKVPGSEAYYVLKGTLTQITLDQNKKATAQSRAVEFKSFPADAQVEPRKKD